MKATIEISDNLYRRVKAKSAMEGKPIRQITEALYRDWLEGRRLSEPQKDSGDWVDAVMEHALPYESEGPVAREILEADRGRLD